MAAKVSLDAAACGPARIDAAIAERVDRRIAIGIVAEDVARGGNAGNRGAAGDVQEKIGRYEPAKALAPRPEPVHFLILIERSNHRPGGIADAAGASEDRVTDLAGELEVRFHAPQPASGLEIVPGLHAEDPAPHPVDGAGAEGGRVGDVVEERVGVGAAPAVAGIDAEIVTVPGPEPRDERLGHEWPRTA